MTTLHWADSRLEIHLVVVGSYANNVFVLRCRDTGEAVLIDAANERGVVMVFQNPLLFPHLTVADNVGFGLRKDPRPAGTAA